MLRPFFGLYSIQRPRSLASINLVMIKKFGKASERMRILQNVLKHSKMTDLYGKKPRCTRNIPRYARIRNLPKNRDMRIRAVRIRVMRGLPVFGNHFIGVSNGTLHSA